MCKYGSYIIFLLFTYPFIGYTQAIDNTISLRNINNNHYIRLFYENDFFSGTDRDYTQGVQLELVALSFNKNPLSKILFHPKNSTVKYGIAIETDGYTPNHLDDSQILYGDRPYAGVLMLNTFSIAANNIRHERISTEFSTGIIGSAAGNETIQKGIHHLINYIQPLGWHNQIRNDVVLNYQLDYERALFSSRDWISLASFTSFRFGTLSTKISAGFTAMLGNFYSPFKNHLPSLSKKFQWYVYEQPLVSFVGYDATLQGGVFNRSSPYTIADRNIERFTFQHKFGIVFIFKKIYLEYFQTGITQEFATSVYHRTGGLQIGFVL